MSDPRDLTPVSGLLFGSLSAPSPILTWTFEGPNSLTAEVYSDLVGLRLSVPRIAKGK